MTDFAGRVDLLAIDQEGTLYVVEIKKDRTPREVVAQAMDYGYWARDLGYEDVRTIFARYREGTEFEEAACDMRLRARRCSSDLESKMSLRMRPSLQKTQADLAQVLASR